MTDTVEAIRARMKALANWKPYDVKTTGELQQEIEHRAIIDITLLLAELDSRDKKIAKLEEHTQQGAEIVAALKKTYISPKWWHKGLLETADEWLKAVRNG